MDEELSNVKSELRQVSYQHEEVNKQYKQCVAQLTQLARSLDDQSADNKKQISLAQTITDLHERASQELVSLKKQLLEAISERDRLAVKSDTANQTLEHMSSELQSARHKLAQQEAALLKQQSATAAFQTSSTKLQSEVFSLTRRVQELSSEKESQNSSYLQIQENYNQAKKELEEIKKVYLPALQEKDLQNSRQQSLGKEIERVLGQASKLKTELDTIQAENEHLKNEKVSLEVRLRQLETDKQNVVDYQALLDIEVAKTVSLREKYETALKQLAQAQSKLSALTDATNKERAQGLHLQSQIQASLETLRHLSSSSEIPAALRDQLQLYEIKGRVCVRDRTFFEISAELFLLGVCPF